MRDLRLAIGAIFVMLMVAFYPRSRKQQRVIEIQDQIRPEHWFFDDQKRRVAVSEPIQISRIEIEKEEIKEEKKKIVGTGSLSDMFNWYDSHKWKVEARKNYKDIPYNDPKKHFRWNIERIIKMSKEEVDLERGQRYIKNVQEVLTHSTKQNA